MESANTALMVVPPVTLGDSQMFYLETNQTHWLVWPCLAVGIDDELWIGVGWFNFEIGWRNGDGGWGNEAKLKEKNT
jgi:hypothetical protein